MYRDRIVLGAAATAAVAGAALMATGPEPATQGWTRATTEVTERQTFECRYEDVLAFELKSPAYDLPAGYTICVHIDQVRDQPTPEDAELSEPGDGRDDGLSYDG